MFNFEHIEHLLALAAVPILILLYLLAFYRKKRVAKKIGDPVLVKELTKRYNPAKFTLKFFLIILGFIAASIAFANIRSATDSEKVKRNGIDVMVALDVSNSMLAQDVTPSRLDRAKQVVARIIDRLDNDRVGLVVFAGKAYLQMPLTADHGAAKMYLSSATPASVPTQGTVIGEALRMCYLSFNNQEKKFKAVVVLSDGEDHDESANQLAKQMAADGVVIYTVGLGSAGGAPVPDVETGGMKMDNLGNVVVSRLNEEALQKISSAGQGKYQLFTSTDAVVSNIVNDLKTMDKRAITDESLLNYESYFQIFLALALFFLILEMFISETRKKTINGKLKPAITTLCLLIGFTVNAQDDKELVKKGNEAYKLREYPTAIKIYSKAAEMNPSNQAAIYNLGSALYRNNDSAKAITAYDMAMKSAKVPLDKSNSFYNKGVVYHNNKRLTECIEAYKSALRINPNDEDARHNLQKALQEQKQKQQQDKQNDKQKDKNQAPKQQRSKLSQQDAEDKLKALQQQERNLHDKLKKVDVNAPNRPEKDW